MPAEPSTTGFLRRKPEGHPLTYRYTCVRARDFARGTAPSARAHPPRSILRPHRARSPRRMRSTPRMRQTTIGGRRLRRRRASPSSTRERATTRTVRRRRRRRARVATWTTTTTRLALERCARRCAVSSVVQFTSRARARADGRRRPARDGETLNKCNRVELTHYIRAVRSKMRRWGRYTRFESDARRRETSSDGSFIGCDRDGETAGEVRHAR